MSIIRVTKEFKFEMGHALLNYDGLCKHIHGHSYMLYVTIKGKPIKDVNAIKNGMVMDFGDLTRIVKDNIVLVYDHSLALNKDVPNKENLMGHEMFDRLHLLDFQPTCENFVIHFAEIIKPHLPQGVELYSIKLYETAKAYAEWYAADNE